MRQYFPKGTDSSLWCGEDLQAVALALNNRPRKDVRLQDLGQSSSRSNHPHSNSPALQQQVELAQYTSADFAKTMGDLGVRVSMGRTGALGAPLAGAQRGGHGTTLSLNHPSPC